MATQREWLTQVRSLVEGAGLTLSPAIFTVASTPKGMIDRSFCLPPLRSRNTKKYATGSDELIRMGRTLVVRFCRRLTPAAQFESQLDAADIEETVIAKLVRRANMPDSRVDWSETLQSVNASREILVVDVIFDVEHDWTFSSLP